MTSPAIRARLPKLLARTPEKPRKYHYRKASTIPSAVSGTRIRQVGPPDARRQIVPHDRCRPSIERRHPGHPSGHGAVAVPPAGDKRPAGDALVRGRFDRIATHGLWSCCQMNGVVRSGSEKLSGRLIRHQQCRLAESPRKWKPFVPRMARIAQEAG